MLAGALPARVQRLVLVEGLGPVTEDPKHAAERLGRALEDEQRKQGRHAPVHRSHDDAVRRLEASMSKLTRASAHTLVARGLREVEGGFTWRSDPRLRLPSRVRMTEEQVLAILRAITCPVLLVRASEGLPFAPNAHSARVAALRQAEVVELPGGHHLHLDTPEPVAAVIGEFLAPLGTAC
jgi:pimeloyl-ACP methyl ester carboxylesterase